MIKAIIFDCFGVLITDALGPLVDAFRINDPEGADKVGDLIRATSSGQLSREEFTEQVATILGLTPDELRAATDKGEVKNAPLLAYIASLRKQYKTAALSNVSVGAFRRRFSDEEIGRYFDVVVPSAEIGYVKPEVQAYLITAQKLGVRPEECVMVDDRVVCCEGAQDAGMQSILYESLHSCKHQLDKLLLEAV